MGKVAIVFRKEWISGISMQPRYTIICDDDETEIDRLANKLEDRGYEIETIAEVTSI